VVSTSRQCSSTPIGFVQGFLIKEQCDNIGASPYSPDLAAGDFYLFPPLKSALKGRRFYGATDIIKNATKELKIFHTMAPRNVSNNPTVAVRSV
jgi:hypothetical protein